ncbi:hypothetical protein [Hymenobacter psychrotolerans]|uniref:hypothetical protein n=1 Tax=Hymenobacter psychrotolerans TaxID=344998 RepID=UPI001FCD66FB|nr:hypothetical protein [Hymenobacter psychrotolerans]
MPIPKAKLDEGAEPGVQVLTAEGHCAHTAGASSTSSSRKQARKKGALRRIRKVGVIDESKKVRGVRKAKVATKRGQNAIFSTDNPIYEKIN